MVKIRAITLVSEPAEYIFTNGCGKEERRKHLHLHWSKRSQRGAHRTPLFILAAWLALVIWLNDCWTKGIKSDWFKSDLMRTVEDVASCMASVTVFSTLDARIGFWQIKWDNECSLLPDVIWNHLCFCCLSAFHWRAFCWVSLCNNRGWPVGMGRRNNGAQWKLRKTPVQSSRSWLEIISKEM